MFFPARFAYVHSKEGNPRRFGGGDAMTTDCPRDQHPRFLEKASGRLKCSVKDCPCAECHKPLSKEEQKKWARE